MKIALHICCAVCAAGAAERLMQEGNQVYGFFFNPNIHPEDEYRQRLQSTRKAALELGFPLAEGPYCPDNWHQAVKLLEDEPEGGQRCPVCFRMRLEKTYQFMLESGCEAFATTLTMGSNKSAVLIERLGRGIGGETFLSRDFKKKDGFKRAGELARIWGALPPDYCGCILQP
jgi:predicted adenine nucleotide alpha hydrolase (AANH) superfamily ATPase